MLSTTDKLTVACTAICILCLAAVAVWSGTVLDTNSTTAQIQRERARNTLRACQEQNTRHDGTIDTLNRVVLERLSKQHVPAAVPPREVEVRLAAAMKLADPPVRTQIEQSIGSTILLIDALAPRRDCPAYVDRQIDTK